MNSNQRFAFLPERKFIYTCLLLILPIFMSAQLDVTLSGVSPTCNGWTNGSVGAMVSNGTPPYLFSWNGGAQTGSNVLASVGAGTYNVVVTDANNQTGSASFTLTEPSAIMVNVTSTGGCAGGGGASVSASGGTGGYTYLWDNGATGISVSGLSSGVHCVTVTDANGCQAVGCTTVTDALALDLVVQGLACFNFCDASITAEVSGGQPPYSYSWSNGFMGGVNANLPAGTYSVTVTDANGCTVTGSTTVGNPPQLNINVSVNNPPCASGGTGSATATASGGTAPYIFHWSNGATGPSVSGLAPGTYTVTVTDFLGCQGTATVMVIEDDGVELNVLSTPSSGCGAADGTASVSITGGTPPFNISWSNGSTASDVSGLAPGTYTVMVTDANGCGASASVTVGGSSAIDLNIMGVNGGCAANGSANAAVIPGTGTPPFQYLWSNGATTPIINNLASGTYSVTVTDAAGCTASDQVTVTGASNINVATSTTDASCFGGNDGTATATVTGATGQVFYMWSNGGSSQTISGLSAGTYFVTVVDNASGCTATTNAFVGQPTEVVASATGINAGCNTPGSAQVSASGGTAPYTYLWSTGDSGTSISGLGGGTYTVTVTDANGCTDVASVSIAPGGALNITITITNPISGSTVDDGAVEASASGGVQPYTYMWNTGDFGPTLSGLAGGTYTVTVTDIEGCSGTASVFLEQLGCIGDRVWEDKNRDGCQDPGEIGVGGITVTLTGTDVNGNTVNMTMQTQPNGYYLFEDLVAGDYMVEFEAPANFAFSPLNGCTDDFTDSDVNSNGKTGTISLASGQCNVTVDAGIYDDCENISDPGTICCSQFVCGPGNAPNPITATPATGGGSPVQYMWMYSTINVPFNTNFWSPIPGATGPTYDPGPLQETTYFIRCAKASACSEWLESNPITIEVGNEAYASISGPDLVCEGDQVTYMAAWSGAGASYYWDFGPWATPSTSNEQNPTITWNQWGVAYITLTVTNNDCVSTTELGVAISNSPILCGNGLIINTTNTANAVSIEWEMEKANGLYSFVVQRSNNGTDFVNLANMPQAQEAGMNHYTFMDYFPKKGKAVYRVQLLENGQHHSFSNEALVQRFDEAEKFIAYPNPVNDQLIVEAGDEVNTVVKAELLTLQGKLISVEKMAKDAMNHTIDMSTMRSGVYFLRLTYNNGEKEVIRVVKK